MANTIPVKIYTNTMPGMPQITNLYGDTTAVLDMVLVNGGPLANVTSVTYAAGVLTVETDAPHGQAKDTVVELIGAVEEEYNGEFRITEIVSSTVFKTAAGDTPSVGTATGTIQYRIPPLGFGIAFTDTNRRAYRSNNVTGTRPYLRVDNNLLAEWDATYAISSRITAARTMSALDTITDGHIPFDPLQPTINDVITDTGGAAINGWFTWKQSFGGGPGTTESTSISGVTDAHSWVIIGDDRAFYFLPAPFVTSGTDHRVCYGFGEFPSFKPADAYNYFLSATQQRQTADTAWYAGYGNEMARGGGYSMGLIIGKNYTGYGHHCSFTPAANQFGGNASGTTGSTAIIPFPNGADVSLWCVPRYIVEQPRGDVRGVLPGSYYIPHNLVGSITDSTIVENVYLNGAPTQRKIFVAKIIDGSTGAAFCAFDITGPWR